MQSYKAQPQTERCGEKLCSAEAIADPTLAALKTPLHEAGEADQQVVAWEPAAAAPQQLSPPAEPAQRAASSAGTPPAATAQVVQSCVKVAASSPVKAGDLFETPPKPPRTGWGGKQEKATQCKACNINRGTEDFLGGACSYCVKACRQLFKHQRVNEALSCTMMAEQLRGRSAELRPAEKILRCRNTCSCSHDFARLSTLAEKLETDLLPRLEGIVDTLVGSNAKKRKASAN